MELRYKINLQGPKCGFPPFYPQALTRNRLLIIEYFLKQGEIVEEETWYIAKNGKLRLALNWTSPQTYSSGRIANI